MNISFVLVSALASLCAIECAHGPVYDLNNAGALFQSFVHRFNKQYSGEEYFMRLGLFIKTLRKINSINSDDSLTWTAGINEMADWTAEEYRKYRAPGMGDNDRIILTEGVRNAKPYSRSATCPACAPSNHITLLEGVRNAKPYSITAGCPSCFHNNHIMLLAGVRNAKPYSRSGSPWAGTSVEEELHKSSIPIPLNTRRNLIKAPYNCPEGQEMDENKVCREVW